MKVLKTKRCPLVEASINRVLKYTQTVPSFNYSSFDPLSHTVSFFLLGEDQGGLGAFFYEMVTRSLSGRVSFFFHAKIEGNQLVAQLEMTFQNQEEWESLKGHLEMLRHELLLGIRSPYHARRILELKGMTTEEKRMRIQERIVKTIQRFPIHFDYDFFSFMQHYFLKVHQESLRFHQVQQISENLARLYQIRRRLIQKIEEEGEKRSLFLKARKRKLHLPFGVKDVLGISVGLNFLREREVFSEKHLIKAIQVLIPDVKYFKETIYLYEDSEYPLLLLYIEIDSDEQKLIERELPFLLQGRVEHLQHPLFMPPNEEEVMRHVITLTGQLKFSRDLPQVVLSFYEQTDKKLYFTIILVRILLPNAPLVSEWIQKLSQLNPHIERIKKVGMVRRKYFKEALVLKVELSIGDFLRDNQSVDLYKARLFVLNELQKVVGEVRDYNGGMLSKQNEVLVALNQLLGKNAQKNQFLVDQFFHSLFPVEKRSLTSPEQLKIFFDLFLEVLYDRKPFSTLSKDAFYLVVETMDKQGLERLEQISFSSKPVILRLTHDERFFVGVITEASDSLKRKIFSIFCI